MATELNVFNDCTTDDRRLAGLLAYAGYLLTRFTNVIGKPSWQFRGVLRHDLEVYIEEAKSESTTVVYQQIGLAFGLLNKVAAMSRSSQGVWESKAGWTIYKTGD